MSTSLLLRAPPSSRTLAGQLTFLSIPIQQGALVELDCLPAEVKQAARPDKEACWPRSCGRAPELAVGLMKVLSPIALLVVALACARGELLTFREQGLDSETLVVLDDQSGGDDAQFVGMVQQFDLSRPDDSARQSFTFWPSSSAFLDGGVQIWVEQQLSMLDSLQGLLVPRCAHAAAATAQATPPQSDYPTVLSYMASSRFGSPSVLTAYARQVDQDSEPAMINVWFDNGDGEALDEEVALGDDLSDWLSDAALPDATSSVSTAAEDTVARNLEEGGSWFGRQYEAVSSQAIEQVEPLFQSTASWADRQLQQPLEEEGPAVELRQDEAAEEEAAYDVCSMGLFLVLCIGCIAVWVGLVRAWVSCCALEQQAKAAKKTKAKHSSMANPLLAPLIPEAATGNPAFTGVEVASEHPTRGSFYAPQGTEYVSIAYMPLQSEGPARV